MTEISNINDVEQVLYLLGVEFNRVNLGRADIFDVPIFGVKVVVYDEGDKFNPQNIKGFVDGSWRVVLIKLGDDLEERKMEIIWELMESGYMHYLRMSHPRTFKHLVSLQGWDRKIISKRLEIYGNSQKYSYLKELNEDALKESASFILSLDPGFFDFLV